LGCWQFDNHHTLCYTKYYYTIGGHTMACTCGFSTEFPKCNGTHKIVNNVKGRILDEIDSISLGDSNDQLNALGMKLLIIEKIKGLK
jgi:hypothetical protein